MKCVSALSEKETTTKHAVCYHWNTANRNVFDFHFLQQYDIIVLGGLTGRLDQTIHTLSYLHKLRKTRKKVFVVTDDNVGWVLDEVFFATPVRISLNLTIGNLRANISFI